MIAVTLTGSPRDAIARTPIHCFVPRSQIKHSYGLDHLQCVRQPLLPQRDLPHFHHHCCAERNRNTLACRVETFLDACSIVTPAQVSRESRRGTHECVRHIL